MKFYKKNIILLSLMISMQIFAAPKNKQQIFLTNEYGQDVTVKLVWKSESFPYFSQDDVMILREHDQNFMTKAPYSFYKLIGMTVHPCNGIHDTHYLENEEDDFEIPLDASNEDVLDERHINNNKYFIIKASQKDSAIPSQKKIYIKGYTSQQKYASEINKIEQKIKNTPVEQPQVVKAQIMVAQQPQLNNKLDYYSTQAQEDVEHYADVADQYSINPPTQRAQFTNNNRHRKPEIFPKQEPRQIVQNISTNRFDNSQEEEIVNPMYVQALEKHVPLSLPKPLNLPYKFDNFK